MLGSSPVFHKPQAENRDSEREILILLKKIKGKCGSSHYKNFVKTGANQFLKTFLKIKQIKIKSKWKTVTSTLEKTSKWETLKFINNFLFPEPKCCQNQHFMDISTSRENSFTTEFRTSSISARNANTEREAERHAEREHTQLEKQRCQAVSVCPGLLQCPVPAQSCSWHSSEAVPSLPCPQLGGSGEPGDASVISYHRLAGAAGPNAAFVAQHCPAERLQLLLNACQSTLGLHYSWGFAWCHGKTVPIYPLPYFQFALLRAGHTKTRINGN